MIQPWTGGIRLFEHTSTLGHWNTAERVEDGSLRRILTRNDSLVYDWYDVDPLYYQPNMSTNAPGVDDGRTCEACGYHALMAYTIQYNTTVFRMAEQGTIAWLEPHVWLTTYLMGCARPLARPETGEFDGSITSYFEFSYMQAPLANLVSTPSEKIFIVQPGSPNAILATSDPTLALLELQGPGNYVPIPFVATCPICAALDPLIGSVQGAPAFVDNGTSYLAAFSTYNISYNIRFVIIQVVAADDYLGAVNRGFMVVAAIVSCICVALALLCVLVASRITQPLVGLLGHLDDISHLRLRTVADPSQITEIRRIYYAVNGLVAQLAEYKTYLPDLEVMRQAPGSGDEGDDGESGYPPRGVTAGQYALQTTSVTGGSGHPPPNVQDDFRSSDSSDSDAVRGPRRKGRATDPRRGARQSMFRCVTIVAVDITEFHQISNADPEIAVTVFEKVLDVVSMEVKQTRGTLCRFFGGNFVAAWNAIAKDSSHAINALETATSIHEKLEIALLRETVALEAHGLRLRVGLGVASSSVLLGTMGTALNRTFNLIGPVCNFAAILAKLCRRYEVPVLCDEAVVHGGAYSRFQAIPMDVVAFPKFKPKDGRAGHLIYSVTCNPKATGADLEWMYALQTMCHTAQRLTTDAFNSFLAGDLEGAEALLSKVEVDDTHHHALAQATALLHHLIHLAKEREIVPRLYVSPIALPA
eukprot:TRINITY_DN4298_c0_g1_i1.p1 TRINITY_DN4298_c0_g1~~TRINITY_DN4298_c0_g1_i1.p1  ORF type:complete len:810 (-),score=148.42 TRINITY_DN4298_c0_g1_i1:167-2269(-)